MSRPPAALAALAMALVMMSGAVAAKPAVIGVRIGVDADTTRVVLDLTGALAYTIFTLPEPYRVVIDLPEVDWRLRSRAIPARRGLVERFRYGLFRPGTSRLVLDVGAPVVVRKAFLLEPTADVGHRLVIDLTAVSPDEFRRRGRPAPSPEPEPPPPSVAPRGDGRPVIVIDPGHGGVDPGTIGASGVYEKQITLAVALGLERQLKATGRYVVKMTRRRDVFVRLRRRLGIARAVRASLFISLHADAIADKRLRGAAVYSLSEKASDAEAAALAAKENRADIIAGVDFAAEAYSDDVTNILIDLAQRETKNLSALFAAAVIAELGKETRLVRKTHRFAGFRVLKAPDVPSVLVELGYLSNRRDERMLRDPAQQGKLMRAIVRAIDRFFAEMNSASRT